MAIEESEKLPDVVYRYFALTEPKRTEVRSLLVDGHLWLTNPRFFNDPFDLLPSFDEWTKQKVENELLLKSVFNPPDQSSKQQHLDSLRSSLHTTFTESRLTVPLRFREDFGRKFGMICFSACPHDVLMWSHYAQSHRGIVVGLDANDPALLGQLARVNYSKSRPRFKPKDAFQMLFTKAEQWRYENEVRGVYDLSKVCLDKIQERHFVQLKKASIKSIRLGWLLKPEKESSVWLSRLLREIKFDRSKISAMTPSSDQFSLQEEQLSKSFFYRWGKS